MADAVKIQSVSTQVVAFIAIFSLLRTTVKKMIVQKLQFVSQQSQATHVSAQTDTLVMVSRVFRAIVSKTTNVRRMKFVQLLMRLTASVNSDTRET